MADVERPAGPDRRPYLIAAALVAVAVALTAGVFIGIASHGNDEAVAAVPEDSVDVGFARDMRDHHAQAVEMSVLVREATADPETRTLALDILLTQQQQIGQMYAWLATWGHPQAGLAGPMAWMTDSEMDHGEMEESSAQMPGMATEQQLARLERAEGRQAERLFLQLMIPHHEAGVEMAEYAAREATQPEVQRLAQSIVEAQAAELVALRSMLEERGGPVAGL